MTPIPQPAADFLKGPRYGAGGVIRVKELLSLYNRRCGHLQ